MLLNGSDTNVASDKIESAWNDWGCTNETACEYEPNSGGGRGDDDDDFVRPEGCPEPEPEQGGPGSGPSGVRSLD